MIEKITVAFVIWLILSCVLAYCLDATDKKIKHRRKVIAKQNRAIERTRKRNIQMCRQRTFMECYLYGLGIDTTKIKKGNFALYSFKVNGD